MQTKVPEFADIASAELKQALAKIQSTVVISDWSIETRVSPDETVLALEVTRRHRKEARNKFA